MCELRPPSQTVIVALPAEIDLTTAEQVHGLLAAALMPGVVLIADLTGTTFCDVGGVRALVRARDQAVAAGSELRLAVTPGLVRRILDLMNLDGQLPVYGSNSEAAATGTPMTSKQEQH